jgi:hypothetical protein
LGEYMPPLEANEMVRYLAGNHSWEQLGNDDQQAAQYARGYWGSLGNAHDAGKGRGIDEHGQATICMMCNSLPSAFRPW